MSGGDKIKYNHWIPKLISLIPGIKINAIVLFKTAYFRQPKNEISLRLIRHEKEHVQQQREEGLLFYSRYFYEYLCNLINYKNHYKAYYYISYEIEARKAETQE